MKLYTLSASALRALFLKGDVSAVEIVDYFFKRIESYDKEIQSFLRLFPEKARQQAQKLDEKRKRGEKLGKLAGIPIAIKDIIHIQGEVTTCGSKILENFKAPFDATVTRLLKEEDAIFMGKTNLDEFAMGSSTEHSAYLQTHNPWNLKCAPGGSSGGSAAAVAARLVPLSLGTDTGGSVRQPASLCGIVGMKPTYGRVSRYGLVAYGSSLDQIGPFATNVTDLALLHEVIGQPCKHDSTSLPEPGEPVVDKLNRGIKGFRIGVPWEFLENLEREPRQLFEKSLETFKNLGAEMCPVNLNILKYAIPAYYIIATAEASTNLARFDGIRYGLRSKRAQTLEEVYKFSKEEGFGEEVKRRILLGTFVLSAGYQDAYYKKAQKVRALMIAHFKQSFQECDLIAMPTSPSHAFELGSIKDPLQMYLEDIYTIGINLVGVPALSIPCGLTSANLPFGLQLIGPQRGDTKVLCAAAAFEKAHPLETVIPPLYDKEVS